MSKEIMTEQELRLQVLHLAEGELNSLWSERVAVMKDLDQKNYNEYLNSIQENKVVPETEATPCAIKDIFPSTEDIINRANELYSFVNSNE